MNGYYKSAVPKTPIKVVYSTLVDWCLSVCTGSAVFAACGLLNGKTTTSNKKAFVHMWAGCKMGKGTKILQRWKILHFGRSFVRN